MTTTSARAPSGYPVPQPAHRTVTWDAAAYPAGQELADAAARLIARMSDLAVAARWAAWDTRPADVPAPEPAAAPGRATDKAAAQLLMKTAHDLLCMSAAGADDVRTAAPRRGAR